MLGGGLVMKLAPCFDLLPSQLSGFQNEQKFAFDLFAKTPLVALVLRATEISMPGPGLMVLLAIIELIIAELLLLSSYRFASRLAGAWMMIEMVGAEYCLRMSGFHRAFFEGYEIIETWMMTGVHLFFAWHGFRLVAGGDDTHYGPLGLGEIFLRELYKLMDPYVTKVNSFLSSLMATVLSCCQKRVYDPARKAGATAVDRGRAAVASRTATPPPSAGTKKD